MIKKMMALFLGALLAIVPLGGCGSPKEDGRVQVVCTVFPVYDWVRTIVGEADHIEVILLAQNGADLHSYQPTAADMARIASCDLLVRVGGDSDEWVVEMLESAPRTERTEVVLTEAPGVVLREVSAESVAAEHEHEHDHTCVTDEHLWLSVKNAMACVDYIAARLCEAEGVDAEVLGKNAADYRERLAELDARFAATVAEAAEPSMLVADRFPFVYLTEDYGIRYMAAFEGCTTETDADFDTMIRLAKTLDEWGLSYVTVTESSDRALARAVIEASRDKNQTVAVLNAMQSVTAAELEEGISYYSVMEDNLAVLRQILLH